MREEILKKLQEVRTAIKVLCFLYPDAAGKDRPKSAGIILRRFQLREQDLVDILDTGRA